MPDTLRFVLGFVDGTLLSHDQLSLNGQKSLRARQPQLQHLMADPVPTLGVVKITTDAFDLAPGAGFAAIIHHESGLGAATHLIGLINPPAQLAVQTSPVDVFPAQEIIEDAHSSRQKLTQLSAEAVERFHFQERPD